MSIPLIAMACLENLHVTDIIILNLFLISKSISIKSSTKVKKRTGGDFIGYKDL